MGSYGYKLNYAFLYLVYQKSERNAFFAQKAIILTLILINEGSLIRLQNLVFWYLHIKYIHKVSYAIFQSMHFVAPSKQSAT